MKTGKTPAMASELDAAECFLGNKYEMVFFLFLAVLAYLWKDNPNLSYPEILLCSLLLLSLNLAAGVALRRLQIASDAVSAGFIAANGATVTLMVRYSGGAESNLWVLYLIPIYSSCLLLSKRGVAVTAASAVALNAAFAAGEVHHGGLETILELLLKSGLFLFTSTATWRIADRERRAKEALRNKRRELQELLGSGYAHELCNIFQVIRGFSELGLMSESVSSELKQDLTSIHASSMRGIEVLSELRNKTGDPLPVPRRDVRPRAATAAEPPLELTREAP